MGHSSVILGFPSRKTRHASFNSHLGGIPDWHLPQPISIDPCSRCGGPVGLVLQLDTSQLTSSTCKPQQSIFTSNLTTKTNRARESSGSGSGSGSGSITRVLYLFACNRIKCSSVAKGWQCYRAHFQDTKDKTGTEVENSCTGKFIAKKEEEKEETSVWDASSSDQETSDNINDYDDIEALFALRDLALAEKENEQPGLKISTGKKGSSDKNYGSVSFNTSCNMLYEPKSNDDDASTLGFNKAFLFESTSLDFEYESVNDVGPDEEDDHIKELLKKYKEAEEEEMAELGTQGDKQKRDASVLDWSGEVYEKSNLGWFEKFHEHIDRAPGQCMRYYGTTENDDEYPEDSDEDNNLFDENVGNIEGIPKNLPNETRVIWPRKPDRELFTALTCRGCGSELCCELQLVSNVIYHLGADRALKPVTFKAVQTSSSESDNESGMVAEYATMDWATVVVCSCSKSCIENMDRKTGLAKEIIIVQAGDFAPITKH